jgi:hypothetical protein
MATDSLNHWCLSAHIEGYGFTDRHRDGTITGHLPLETLMARVGD